MSEHKYEFPGVLMLSALYAIVFSWRLHLLELHAGFDWPYFRTMDQFTPPIAPQYGLSQWRLESRIFSPWILLHWLCGPAIGINLELPIHLAIAFSGGWVLARVLKLGWLPALTCAAVYPSSSWIYLHFSIGHLSFLPFAYSPWMVAALLIGTWRATVGLAVLMALSFFEGGLYPILETGVLLGILGLALTWQRRSLRPLGTLLITALLSTLLATPKLAQVWPTESRSVPGCDGHLAAAGYASSFFSRDQTQFRTLQWLETGGMGFWESGAYLSPFIVPLVAAGAGSAPWVVAAFLMLAFGMGNYFGPHSPYCFLHALPMLAWMRVSPRWFIMAMLCFGVLAASGVERLSRSRAGTVAAVLLLAAGLCDCWWVSTGCLGLIGSIK